MMFVIVRKKSERRILIDHFRLEDALIPVNHLVKASCANFEGLAMFDSFRVKAAIGVFLLKINPAEREPSVFIALDLTGLAK